VNIFEDAIKSFNKDILKCKSNIREAESNLKALRSDLEDLPDITVIEEKAKIIARESEYFRSNEIKLNTIKMLRTSLKEVKLILKTVISIARIDISKLEMEIKEYGSRKGYLEKLISWKNTLVEYLSIEIIKLDKLITMWHQYNYHRLDKLNDYSVKLKMIKEALTSESKGMKVAMKFIKKYGGKICSKCGRELGAR